jgi:hypothetical protein
MPKQTYVLIEPNPFSGNLQTATSYVPKFTAVLTESNQSGILPPTAQKDAERQAVYNELLNVSRPLTGISVKPNTHAYVQIVDSAGAILKVFNKIGTEQGRANASAVQTESGVTKFGISAATSSLLAGSTPKPPPVQPVPKDGNAHVWTDWLLQSVQEERVEKTQIVETFGRDYFYVLGEKPRALQFSGILMNTADFNWRAVFWENWDRFFRATRLVERNARMYIGFDDIVVEGYPINAVAVQQQSEQNMMSFSFTFFVTNYINLAAQGGFSDMAAMNNISNTVRGGYSQNQQFNLRSSKKSIIELLGYQGFAKVGNAAEEAMAPIVGDKLAAQAGKQVSMALNLAATGAFAVLAGKAETAAFIRAFTLRTTYETLRFGIDNLVDATEQANGLKSGEINQWFGLVSSIVSSSMGAEFVASNLPGPLAALLTYGSVERIVQSMAYGITSAITEGMSFGTDMTLNSKGQAGTATRVSMSKISYAGGFGARLS